MLTIEAHFHEDHIQLEQQGIYCKTALITRFAQQLGERVK
jgi:hypothetical protein